MIKVIKADNIKKLSFWEIEDKWFREELLSIEKNVEEIKEVRSPMFLTDKNEFKAICPLEKARDIK